MKLTWLGHSAFRLEFGASKVLVDPFLTLAREQPNNRKVSI